MIEFKEICASCGLEGDKYVECKGIYYCANPLCTISGATRHKEKAPGVEQDTEKNSLVIVEVDMFWDWCKDKYETEADPNIKAAMKRMLPYWERAYKKWMETCFTEEKKRERCANVCDS